MTQLLAQLETSPNRRWLRPSGLALVLIALPSGLRAQADRGLAAPLPMPTVTAAASLPDAPVFQAYLPATPGQRSGSASQAAVSGTVLDSYGDVLVGASITLVNMATSQTRTLLSGTDGYFRLADLEAGIYKLNVAAAGFASWTETAIPVRQGTDFDLPPIALRIAAATTDVTVVFSQYELATEQIHIEEKQRILGVIPNFYTSYVWHAAPLTAGQKFKLALRSSVDPFSFAASAAIAGVQQAEDDFEGYGQGASGFAKRFGASYGDGLIGNMIGGALLPSLLHQDPRYYYKGTGTIRQRALYAIATTVICKGDNGHWQPNYSNVLGNLAAGGLSNLYYPKEERNGFATTVDNALIGTAGGAVGALIQEFLLRHLTPGLKSPPSP